MIRITLEGVNAEEIQFHAHQLAAVMKPVANPHTGKMDANLPQSPSNEVNKLPDTKVKTPSKKSAKSSKDEPQEALVPNTTQSQNTSPSPEVQPEGTKSELVPKERVTDVFKKITEKFGSEPGGKGIMICVDVLNRFGRKALKEVPPEDMGQVLAVAELALATGAA